MKTSLSVGTACLIFASLHTSLAWASKILLRAGIYHNPAANTCMAILSHNQTSDQINLNWFTDPERQGFIYVRKDCDQEYKKTP